MLDKKKKQGEGAYRESDLESTAKLVIVSFKYHNS